MHDRAAGRVPALRRENMDASALLTDYYELTMANGYFCAGLASRTVCYDIFFRQAPDGGGFCIAAGLEQAADYLRTLRFTAEDISFLRGRGVFSEAFLEYLRTCRFTGDVWAVPEGTPVFPGEPILTVRANAVEAQLVETFLLLTINHQTLIATKANRIVRAAAGRPVSEFGARRAHGPSAAVLGARAAYIGGVASTSCTRTSQLYGVPASGTMAHSWVQMFDSEYEAFKTYLTLYPQNAVLLVDTYHALRSGVPNAIRAIHEVLVPQGIRSCAIRLDSGDLTYQSKQARLMLDAAGLPWCKIVVTNALDEYLIENLLAEGAPVDMFGVGERLITAKSDPVLGGVYKLAAAQDASGALQPRIKVSDNVAKITTPHFKKVYRLYDEGAMAIADLICLYDEQPDFTKPIALFDPEHVWKRKTVEKYTAEPLLVPVFRAGRQVYSPPVLPEIQAYCVHMTARLWDELKRFSNPHRYYVDLSEQLWSLKQRMLEQYGG